MSPETLYFTCKCTKNVFGGQALPRPAGGACSAPHADPLAELKARGGESGESGKWEGEEGKGRW